jgi:predicted small metal-binding protein
VKTLACNDIMPGCPATFEGESEDEILQQAGRHAVEAHGLTVTPEIVEAVRAQIKDAG